jgi:hypothetical protein
MKIYTFNTDEYATQMSVIANSEEEALEKIKHHCLKKELKRLKTILKTYKGTEEISFPLEYTLYGGDQTFKYESLEDYLNNSSFTYDYNFYLRCKKGYYSVGETDINEVLETEIT